MTSILTNRLSPFKRKLFCQEVTVNKLIKSSNDSHQVANQAEEEEQQKGLEMDIFDCQSCSAVKTEEHHLHPEESWEGSLEQSQHRCA